MPVLTPSCLRSWFQRQQTCPTCRMDVLRASLPTQSPPPPEPADQGPPAAPHPPPLLPQPPNCEWPLIWPPSPLLILALSWVWETGESESLSSSSVWVGERSMGGDRLRSCVISAELRGLTGAKTARNWPLVCDLGVSIWTSSHHPILSLQYPRASCRPFLQACFRCGLLWAPFHLSHLPPAQERLRPLHPPAQVSLVGSVTAGDGTSGSRGPSTLTGFLCLFLSSPFSAQWRSQYHSCCSSLCPGTWPQPCPRG